MQEERARVSRSSISEQKQRLLTDGRYFYKKAQRGNRGTKPLPLQQTVSLAHHESSSFTGTVELRLSQLCTTVIPNIPFLWSAIVLKSILPHYHYLYLSSLDRRVKAAHDEVWWDPFPSIYYLILLLRAINELMNFSICIFKSNMIIQQLVSTAWLFLGYYIAPLLNFFQLKKEKSWRVR